MSAVERWLPVEGYEGLYEVSDHGRVRSLDRITPHGQSLRFRAGRVLSAMRQTKHTGHRYVSLSRDRVKRDFYVHRLVLTAFVGPASEGMEGCHNDGDPSNNHLRNLRWDTRLGNARDMVRHGTQYQRRKTHCPRGHLLRLPNLRPDAHALGHRKCRACQLAGDAVRDAIRRGAPEIPDRQVESDRQYARIMTATREVAA